MRCDALILLEIPVSLAGGVAAGAQTTVSVKHSYGSDAPVVVFFPGDISGQGGPGFPDGCVDAFDLGTLLGAWCSSASDPDPKGDVDPPCEGCASPNFAIADLSGPGGSGVSDGCVDAFDLGTLLANWCSVAGGNPCGTCFAPP